MRHIVIYHKNKKNIRKSWTCLIRLWNAIPQTPVALTVGHSIRITCIPTKWLFDGLTHRIRSGQPASCAPGSLRLRSRESVAISPGSTAMLLKWTSIESVISTARPAWWYHRALWWKTRVAMHCSLPFWTWRNLPRSSNSKMFEFNKSGSG